MSSLENKDSKPKHILLIVTNGNYCPGQGYFSDKCALMVTLLKCYVGRTKKSLLERDFAERFGSIEKLLWRYSFTAGQWLKVVVQKCYPKEITFC